MSGIYFPDSQASVPPEAERCPDPTEASGKCRHGGVCHAPRQKFQQKIARMTGADCPWWQGLTAVRHYELEG